MFSNNASLAHSSIAVLVPIGCNGVRTLLTGHLLLLFLIKALPIIQVLILQAQVLSLHALNLAVLALLMLPSVLLV